MPVLLAASVTPAAVGDLDPSFDTGGLVMPQLGVGGDRRRAPAGRPPRRRRHRVRSARGTKALTLARYLPSGAFDAPFGAGGSGVVVTELGAGSMPFVQLFGHAVALAPEGSIVVCGEGSDAMNAFSPPHRMAAALLDANFIRARRVVALDSMSYCDLLRRAPEDGVSGGRTHDAVIAACAVRANVTTLLTFQRSAFRCLFGSRARGRRAVSTHAGVRRERRISDLPSTRPFVRTNRSKDPAFQPARRAQPSRGRATRAGSSSASARCRWSTASTPATRTTCRTPSARASSRASWSRRADAGFSAARGRSALRSRRVAVGAAISDGARARSCRALVLTGSGCAFSAGIDVNPVPRYDTATRAHMIRAIDRTDAREPRLRADALTARFLDALYPPDRLLAEAIARAEAALAAPAYAAVKRQLLGDVLARMRRIVDEDLDAMARNAPEEDR